MKKILFIVGSIVIILIVALFGFRMWTKSHSPYEEIVYDESLTITYCRPFKKDRKIFGGLVAYGEVWRTGANEATILATTKPITFGGQKVEPGKYTIWTIPNENTWSVILNSEIGQWGVDMDGIANRNPDLDVLQVETPVIQSDKVFEQFTMAFEEIHEELELVLVWDQTMTIVPIGIE